MWKPMLVLAVVANTFFISPSEGSSQSMASSSSSSFAESSSFSSSSSSTSKSSSTSSSSSSSGSITKPNIPPKKKCPKPNEVFDPCPAPCPPRNCGVDITLFLCAVPPKPGDPDCEPGCRCRDDYLRTLNGTCVYKDDCPNCTKPNEVYDICPATCPPRRCDEDDRVYDCAPPPKPGDPECEPGCRCANGYVRNNEGMCVTRDECPKCPKPNEVYDECPAPCPPRRCDVDERLIRCAAPPKPGDPECEPGCRCADGYVRNDEGICVTRDQCPKCTKPHEVYDPCPPSCPPQTCESLDRKYHCPSGRISHGEYISSSEVEEECRPACRCERGYYRNLIGECISEKNCRKCCGPHEYFSCGIPCDNVCATLSTQNKTSCPIANIVCTPMCYCEDGYARDDDNICIPIEKCNAPECGDNEIFSECPPFACRPLDCSEVGFPVGCPMNVTKCPGKPACICDYGYVKNDAGKCIPLEECPACGGDPNAVSGCGVNCGRHCSDYKKKDIACIDVCYENACDCKKGFVLDENINKCVPPKACTPICGRDEVYSDCINSGCEPKTCSQLGFPIPGCETTDPKCCIKGCLCKDDYVRADNGTCIPRDKCPSCGGDPNAVAGCGVNCEKHCSDIGKGPMGCAAVCYQNSCDCKPGFFLDDNKGICVLPIECSPICGKNEVYSNCTNGGCGPKECSGLGFKIGCVKMDLKYCREGCLCKEGYLRDANGICIPKSECPECGGDPNAVAGCGINCGRHCYNYDKGPVACILVCLEDACDCRDGYVFDDNIGSCVLPEHCTPTCGVNEVYDTCGNSGCRRWNCSQPVLCIDTFECKGACVCQDKYARAPNGTCIPEDQCELECGTNERFEQCPDTLCTPQYCSQLGFPWPAIPCPPPGDGPCPGPPGCVCDYDYVRDDNGNCIPKTDCPSCGGDPNAVSGCGLNCGRLCSNYDKGPVPCPRICYPNACDCKKDFVLDENTGKCVLPEDCSDACGINEIYDTCGNGGCRRWYCSQPTMCIDPTECIGGCVCLDKYARADNGTCIPEDQCDRCFKPHEYFDACAPTCPPQTCESIDRQYACPAQPLFCRGACRCEEGYYRNNNDDCVTEDDCKKCTGPHEFFACGGACDNVCATLSEQNQTSCPIVNIQCNSMCYCENGYARDDKGICIPIDQCPKKCTGPHEYFACGGACDNVCATLSEQNKTNCPIVNIQCNSMCYCEDGYARDYNGICVPIDQCPRQCNQPHEYYDACAPRCPPQTCESIGRKIRCPIQPAVCIGACRCEEGYYRNKIGECICEEDCKKCTGPHEYFSCGGACDNVCATLNKQNQTNCPIVNIVCNPMCYCEAGYARNDCNICIPIDQCPEPRCADDEIFEECPNNLCIPLACSQLGFPIDCPALSGEPDSPCPGEPACICDYGNVRDDKGNCIPKDQCPSCGGDPNAVTGCGINCGRRCSNYKEPNVVCPLACRLNGCDCRDGYVYDDNLDKCVLPENCTPTCGINEIYNDCANGGCRRWTCSQPTICVDPIKCEGGCICQDGYTRDSYGACIPENQCPGECRLPHEYYDECAPSCPPQTCESIGRQYKCPPTAAVCRGACRCEEGYYRNIIGECISKEDCKKCTGPHEYFSCGGACDNVCATLNKQNQTICPVVNIVCNPMCYCEAEYARNDCNICIPINQCPEPRCADDEIFEECPNNLCIPLTCSQLGFPIDCPALSGEPDSPCPGEPACICDYGNVRDDEGNCIPKDQCPSCGGDPNAESGCGINCGRRCSNYKKKNVVCPLACMLNGCDCKNGYVYDDNLNICVLPENCTPTCGINEVYNGCANGGCRKRSCSQPPICVDPIQCEGGCICQDGYTRDSNGICIPENQCPAPQCGLNERFEECPDAVCAPMTCSELGFPISCPVITSDSGCPGPPGCVCDYGYVRDDNGNCIDSETCPSCGGDPNAVIGCGGYCGNRCSDYNKTNLDCPQICYFNSCDCRKGLVYDDNLKKCVPPENCTPVCGKDEVYSDCINGGCLRKNCSQVGKDVPCVKIDPAFCIKGCLCKEKYLRADNGTCIPEDQCIPKCNKPNEYYEKCIPWCTPETCESIGKTYLCAPTSKPCRGGCRCKKGFYRNKIGECITKKECLKCTKPHEYFSCGGACDNVCATLYKQNQTNCPIINIKCNPMCYCEKGYARDDKKNCIPIDQCPEPTCEKGQHYEKCPAALCEPLKCAELGFPIPCPDIPDGSSCPGSPDCICDDDNVKDDQGNCIPKIECPSCGGDPNAVAGCTGFCGNRCSDYKDKNVTCPEVCYFNVCDCKKGLVYDDNLKKCVPPENCTPTCGKHEVFDTCANGGCDKRNCSQLGQPKICIRPIKCIGRCVCEKGYLRAKNGTCVPETQCPEPQCGPNERFEWCPDALCTPLTCSQLGFPINCPEVTTDSGCPGSPGCVCDYGYVRDDEGNCILASNCPSCGGDPNAVTGCGINCGRLCSNYDKGPVPCPKICKFNACDCRKGYVYDKNIQKCVKPKECTPICGKDEVYSDCINGGCQRKNCSQVGKDVPCVKINPAFCIKGCLCKEKYLRADNGTCIPEDQCKPKCNKPNEYYEKCIPWCTPESCESIGKDYMCAAAAKPCRGGCRCKRGFYRNKIGECITKKECLKCTKPHEYFSCGGACDNVCATLYKQNQTNCPIINIKCNPMCYCEKGYARDNKNNCIPIDQCPEPICEKGQHYEKCPAALCEPLTCAELGFPIPCPDISDGSSCPGPPDCVCDDGNVKDDQGNCIPKNKCPSCGGDPNAVSGCGGYCGNRCSDYKKKNVACPLICYFNACDCKKGYVYDENLKKCVRPKNCTPTCRKNEVFDSCANGGCDKRNCTQLGEPIFCIDPIKCIGGCVCKKGYLRAKNGICVPVTQCPAPCNKPHEVYDPCPPICPPQTCESIGKKYFCPMIPANSTDNCYGQCRCEEGYFRNKLGECISGCDCLKCTSPNEYFSCGSACDNVCATIKTQNQTHCPIVNKKCTPRCYCDEGYARDKNNVCIPIEQCGESCKGDPNAVPGCGINCGRRCSNYDHEVVVCPAICMLDGCDCKENYVYDDNLDICVQPKDCTPTCKENEVFNDCINGGCQKKFCSQLGKPDICVRPKVCEKGCLCKKGYLRHDNGTCVPIDKCEETCNGDPNAEPGCGMNCGRRCSNYNKGPVACAQVCYVNGCDCKKDYVFDDNIGRCVLPENCTPICKVNEVYDSCSNDGCSRKKCSELVDPIICTIPDECIRDCVCIEGFLRDENGVCIPENECNPTCGPHEVYNSCPYDCPPNTCESLGRAYACPVQEFDYCEGRCVCEAGYYSNKIGQCITEDECLQCMGPNEYFSCGGACDNVCATLNEQNQTNCPIQTFECNPMCYCEEGFARDDNNICIPMEDCPGPYCGPNEVYESKPSFVCGPLYCSELGFPMDCPPVVDPNCEDEPACICKEGYVRNEAGFCIPKADCPSCGGDPNAVAGCGVNCGRTCSTFGKDVQCIQVCYPNACDCRDEFVYDEVVGKCVKFEDCYRPSNDSACSPTPTDVNITDAKARLDRATITLSGQFIYQLTQSKPDENFVTSAISILIPIAQIAIFASNLVLKELLKILNLSSKDEIKSVYRVETENYEFQQLVQFNSISKYYANKDYLLSDEFICDSRKYFNASGQNVDFSKNVEAAKTINDWVSNQTHGRIQDLVSADSLDANTVLVLVNAIYYLGDWVHQFNPNNTEKRDFTKRNKEVVQLDTMYQEGYFNYAENSDLNIQALEMPYKNGNFSFFIILPKEGYFDATVQILLDPTVFGSIINSLRYEKVQIYVPKITIDSDMDMAEMLKKANVQKIFDSSSDGLQGILKTDVPLYISAAVQKAFLRVDETGTEAAVASAIGITALSLPLNPPPVFEANRPFLFYVRLKKSILFCGAFVG